MTLQAIVLALCFAAPFLTGWLVLALARWRDRRNRR